MTGTAELNKMHNGEACAFTTLKDHKENFANNPSVRLINPAKNEMGRISKTILDKINNNIRRTLNLNQWKNTQNVTDWFKSIHHKNLHKFVVFDIKEFYPSIGEELLKIVVSFARNTFTLQLKKKE